MESTENTNSESPVDDRRGDIEAAVSQLDGGNDAQNQPQPGSPASEPRQPGSPAAPEAPAAGKPAAAPGQAPGAAANEGKGFGAKQAGAAPGALKPPQAWKPEARELWPKVPAGVQAEIHRWNTAVGRALHDSEKARSFHQEFNNTVTPYKMLLQGQEPMQAFTEYLQVLGQLRTGTPHDKATSFANLVQTFGIDVSLLDAALAAVLHGRQGPAAPQGQQFRDPRVDGLLQAMQERERNGTEQMQRSVAGEIQQFSQNAEFYADLRADMADILELATKRGQQMSLQDAYDRACKMNPEVSNILTQRELAVKAASARQIANRARGASLSVNGAPTVPGGAPVSDGSRRGDIEAAIAQLSGRQ